MRERAPSHRLTTAAQATAVADPAPIPAESLPLAFPLNDFYRRARLRLPAMEVIEADEVPEPYRSLLVHEHDMTPTLSAFYARVIHLRVLHRRQAGEFYFREVVLVAGGLDEPVEFGAIRIHLARFAPAAQRHILDERVPLGDLLRVHAVPHCSQPKAFFRVRADQLMVSALHLADRAWLYGRRNTLLDAQQFPVAEVVEILPPCHHSVEGCLNAKPAGL